MQHLVRLHPHVIPIEQAVELHTREREYRLPNTRPVKAMPLKSLVPENEAVALPHQDLELVTSRVNEREHRPRQRVLLDHVPRQNRQAIDLLPHINRRPVQIHPLDAPIRPQHPAGLPAPPTASSAVATLQTRSPTLARTPAGTPGHCAPLAPPRRSVSVSSSPAPLQTCSCACAVGQSQAASRAGAAPRSRRTPAASQDPSPSHNRSAVRPPGVPPPTSPPQPVASPSTSPSWRTSTSPWQVHCRHRLHNGRTCFLTSLSAYIPARCRFRIPPVHGYATFRPQCTVKEPKPLAEVVVFVQARISASSHITAHRQPSTECLRSLCAYADSAAMIAPRLRDTA